MKKPKTRRFTASRKGTPRQTPAARTKRKRLEDDRSPLDCCAWCLRWLRSTAGRHAIPLQLLEAPTSGQHFVELMIDNHLLLGIVPQPGSEYAEAGAHAIVIVCGDTCAESLEQGLRNDETRARGATPHRREPTERERREAEKLVSRACAWCLTLVASNTPVRCLYASLKADVDRADRPGALMSITIGGRLVPGWSPEAGSRAALEGGDIAFMLCGEECARQLKAAIALDPSLSVVH